MAPVRTWLLGLATLAMGLIAGFFYAYACSVMVGLARTDDRTFILTMQWINATVRNPLFGASFFGALLLTAVACVAVLPHRRVRWWTVAAFALYMSAFGITMGISVPLNDQLALAGNPDIAADPAAIRAAYEDPWVTWNAVRTVAATAAFACLILAIRDAVSRRGRTGARDLDAIPHRGQ